MTVYSIKDTFSNIITLLIISTIECEIPKPSFIVGGRNVTKEEFPYIIFIRNKIPFQEVWVWGAGSILNERWVLSARHLLPRGIDWWRGDVPTYVFPDVNNSVKPDNMGNARSIYVIKKYCAAGFPGENNVYSDLVLFKLNETLQRPKSHFIQIPDEKDVDWKQKILLIGWGRSFSRAEYDENVDLEKGSINRTYRLHATEMNIYQAPESTAFAPCNEAKRIICVRSDTSSACFGDGGGPAVIRKDEVHQLVGVITSPNDCIMGNVLVRLPGQYKKWIENVIENEPESSECILVQIPDGVPGKDCEPAIGVHNKSKECETLKDGKMKPKNGTKSTTRTTLIQKFKVEKQ